MLSTQPSDSPMQSSFFEEHYDQICRYILSLVRVTEEAEDLTQETFLRAYRERETLREPGALVAWLFRIATHVALDRLRQRARRSPREDSTEVEEVEVADSSPSLQQTLEQSEMSDCVQRYIADLPDGYRAVILLHDLHELTAAQIADLLEVSLATVKIRLHRARQRLQATLRAGCNFSYDERGVLMCESKR